MDTNIHGVKNIKAEAIQNEEHDNGEKYYVRKIHIAEKDYNGSVQTHSITMFSPDKNALKL